MQTRTHYTRDLVFFFILLLLTKRFIIDTLPSQNTQIATKQSLHIPDEQDETFLQAITQDKKTIKELVQTDITPEEHELLLDLFGQLSAIEKEYIYMSPGLALLGPISTMYLEIKQQELREKAQELHKGIVEFNVKHQE